MTFLLMICPICINEIKGPKNRIVTECGHTFHSRCLLLNISINGFACPYCRYQMVKQVNQDEPEEEDHPEIQEDDILRGFRLFNNLVNNDSHDRFDNQQERFYQTFLRGRPVVAEFETALGVVTETNDDFDLDKDVNTWYDLPTGYSRYKGQWKNGKPHGKGVEEIFEASFRNADGHPCDENGSRRCHTIIDAYFVDGCAEGYGVQYYDQTEPEEISVPHYKGFFKRGKHHGMGEYHYGTGSYYKGAFRFSKFHGRGIYYDHVSNKTRVCIYIKDVRSKYIVINGMFS